METNKEVIKNKIFLYLISNKIYQKELLRITKDVADNYSKIVYVSLTKPAEEVVENLRENNIDIKKFLFIDAVAEKVKSSAAGGGEQPIFVSSPKNFNQFNTEISQIIKDLEKFECLIFDSLSTLLIYKDESTVVRFTHDLIIDLMVAHASGDFICLLDDSCVHLAKTITPFTDKVIYVGADGEIREEEEKKIDLKKKEKIQSLVKELKAVEQGYKSKFISEGSYLKTKKRIETTLEKLRK